jgi:hypothetical protein
MNIAQNTKLMYKFIHICKFEIFENKSYFKKKEDCNFNTENVPLYGQTLTSFDNIKKPYLGHIAPQTENEKPASGYDCYIDKVKEQL